METTKKLISAFILSVIFIANLQAQNTPKTNLWKIEGDSIKTSYVFGTIHVLPQKDFKITEKLQKAFDDSNKIVLEVDMADANFPTDALKSSLLKEGELLSSFMDEKEYKLLDNYLKENSKVSLEVFNKFKPFALSSLISMATYKGEPMASYEVAFVRMSKMANKEMDGLETIADQIKAIDSKSYEAQLDDFIETIENPGNNKILYKKILNLYLTEDVDGMYENMKEFMNNDAKTTKIFFDDRNIKWIPKFAEYSKEETVFYAVGAGHLGGNNGLLNLLKKAGYTVTPLFN